MENQIRVFAKNEVIFKEGTYEPCMYNIISGSVNIYVNFKTKNEKLLTTLEADQFFGELGAAEVMSRTATAVAAEDDTKVFVITNNNFSDYFRREPKKLLAILQHMSERLRALTQDYLEAETALEDAIQAGKHNKKHRENVAARIVKLVQSSIKPFFVKAENAYNEADYLKSQAEQTRIIKVFGRNEIIFHDGDTANCLYDIHWGRVGIFADYGTDSQKLLTELKTEEYFGEMGLLNHMPRSATAVALEADTKIELITEDTFGDYLQENPGKVMLIMVNLSSRIRTLTKEYQEVCRQAEEALAAHKE